MNILAWIILIGNSIVAIDRFIGIFTSKEVDDRVLSFLGTIFRVCTGILCLSVLGFI